MATSHAKVCEKGFALCLHKSGSFFAYFYRARARDREYGEAIVEVAWRGKKIWFRARARDREYGGAIVEVAWRGKKIWFRARARDREYGGAIVEVAWRVERSYL